MFVSNDLPHNNHISLVDKNTFFQLTSKTENLVYKTVVGNLSKISHNFLELYPRCWMFDEHLPLGQGENNEVPCNVIKNQRKEHKRCSIF